MSSASWPTSPAALAYNRAVLASRRGEADAAESYAQASLRQLSVADRYLRAALPMVRGEAAWLGGQLPRAEAVFEHCIATCQRSGEARLATRPLFALGRVQLARGQLRAAERTFRRGLELFGGSGPEPLAEAGLQHLGLAEVFRQRNVLDLALEHATTGIALGRRLASRESDAVGLATLAWIYFGLGDHQHALATLDEPAREVTSLAVVPLYNPAPAERARLLLALGQVDAVVRWVSDRGLAEDAAPSYAHERDYLVLCRLLLACGTPERALPLLERLHAAAAATDRFGNLIEIRTLQALALAAIGDHARACESLMGALALAEPEGYVRVFADEGPRMAGVLSSLLDYPQRLAAAGVTAAYVRGLERACQCTIHAACQQHRPAPVATGADVDSLSKRELDVLRLLAHGHANGQIAEELVIALDTVKKHVSSILDKLDASNRTQAVLRARERGLIE